MSCEEYTYGSVVLPSAGARRRIERVLRETAAKHGRAPKRNADGETHYDMPVDQPGWGTIVLAGAAETCSVSWWSRGNNQHAYVRRDPLHRCLLAALNTTRWTDDSGGYLRTNDESTMERWGTREPWHTASGWGGLGRELRPRTPRERYGWDRRDLRVNVRVGERIEELNFISVLPRAGVVTRARDGLIYLRRDDGSTCELFQGFDAYRAMAPSRRVH